MTQERAREILAVIQADRDAAADSYKHRGLPMCAQTASNGAWDADPLVQAFAHHRIAEQERAAKVVEHTFPDQAPQVIAPVLDAILTAIRSGT